MLELKLHAKDFLLYAMPVGRKKAGGINVEFDAVSRDIIAPTIEAVGMQPSGSESAL